MVSKQYFHPQTPYWHERWSDGSEACGGTGVSALYMSPHWLLFAVCSFDRSKMRLQNVFLSTAVAAGSGIG